jgi:hypothetical protein
MKDDPLREKLHAWEFDASIPARFQAGVWERIRSREEERAAPGLAGFWRWLLPSRSACQLAGALAAIMVLAGAGLGSLTAAAANEHTHAVLARRYMQVIDPYLRMAHSAER